METNMLLTIKRCEETEFHRTGKTWIAQLDSDQP